MAKVSRTELNQQTARVLARVAAGERLTITDRGRAVAEIARPTESRWEELVASGRVTMPSALGPLPFEAIASDLTSREILDDLRADRS